MNKIENVLDNLKKSSTRKTYESHLNTFFKFINADPETYISPNKTPEDYTNDIIKFLKERKKTRQPKTNNVSKFAILLFLEEYNIEIPRNYRRKINNQIESTKRATTIDKPFTKEEIKLVLPHVKPHINAVILIAISSGMRIGEILKLKNKLIFLKENPVRIHITRDITKTNEARTTFISDEAKDALESYLITRPQHIKYMKNSNLVKSTLKNPYDEELIFQFSYEDVKSTLYRALNKVKLDTRDPTTNRHQKHIHSFRKYFKKHLSSTMDSNCLHQLTGHESELARDYTPWDTNELAKEYLKNMEHITIYGSPLNHTETTKKIKIIEEESTKYKDKIESQTKIIEQMKLKIDSYDQHIKEFEKWKSIQQEIQNNISNYSSKHDIKPTDKFNLPPDELIKALSGYSGKELEEFKISMKQYQEKQSIQEQKSTDELLKLIKEYVQSELLKQKQKRTK